MYLVVDIDGGGFIRPAGATAYSDVIHRESWNLHRRCSTDDTLRDAAPRVFGRRGVAELNERGAVCALWAKEDALPYWTEKLKIWNGCYGSWPLRTMND
jgi:hypothetical protein